MQLSHTLDGSECRIVFVDGERELDWFNAFIDAGAPIAVDTESTGLDIFSTGHRLRLVQFGNDREAFVLDAGRYWHAIADALRRARVLVMHNAPFDMLTLDRHLGVKVEELSGKTFDTRILSHLLDPRARAEGGTGHGLKDLGALYVDADSNGVERALMETFKSVYHASQSEGWALVDLRDEAYVRYAGLDVLITRRLFDVLAPMVHDAGLDSLSQFEHALSAVLATMQRRGMRVDVGYTESLGRQLEAEAAECVRRAAEFGVANMNSTAQVAEALAGMGEELVERTPSGQVKVDKAVLLPLADLDMGWNRLGLREPNPLADAVLRGKRAEKWDETYVKAFLELRDAGDRLHPSINSLQARTARMSISRPPLQQLPSNDWRVRRALIADPGHVVASVDYSQVEVRVAAALSKDPVLIDALTSGEDLHSTTARLIFGDGFTDKDRKIGKMVTFARLYGSGASNIARQAGVDMATAKAAVAGFDRAYLQLARYGRGLQRSAEFGAREVVTPSGRHLPLDRDRTYAALNAMVQSTARDVLAQAILRLHEKGLDELVMLPIHDEVLLSVPKDTAEESVRAVVETLEMDFFGVPLVVDAEIGGKSWGSLYGAPSATPAA